MEFSKKLQNLRKQKGITQEELANKLYVSRTAVSKWESNRGYPSLDSLKDIANYFDVTLDELLSSKELVSVCEEVSTKKINKLKALVFGILDLAVLLLLFLPFFTQKVGETLQEVSLITLTEKALYLRVLYYFSVSLSAVMGVFILALLNTENTLIIKSRTKISLAISIFNVALLIISAQVYASITLFTFLIIKVILCIKL